MSFKTPLGKVRGLGSAKIGTDHFWEQRMTAIANIVLTIGIIIIGFIVWGQPYTVVLDILQSPAAAICLFLFVINTVYHMRLGMQVIIEDYVTSEGKKILAITANNFFCVIVGFTALYALAKINFGM